MVDDGHCLDGNAPNDGGRCLDSGHSLCAAAAIGILDSVDLDLGHVISGEGNLSFFGVLYFSGLCTVTT